jgi:hypothetical protein
MCAAYGDYLLGVLYYFYISFYILFLKFTNLILKCEKYRKTNNRVIDDEWSGMLDMLIGLDGDPYSYDDITDNP